MIYVALLRAINVGGRNPIRMPELRACFEARGFRRVTTFIQSGNVLFEADERGRARLARRIERAVARSFGYPASVVLRDLKQMERVVARAPAGFGSRLARYRYDVAFLKEPLDSQTALKHVLTRAGVDRVERGDGVLYLSRLIREASRSLLSRIVTTPVYASMTIRTWNTTTRLVQLMQQARLGP